MFHGHGFDDRQWEQDCCYDGSESAGTTPPSTQSTLGRFLPRNGERFPGWIQEGNVISRKPFNHGKVLLDVEGGGR